MNCVNREAKLVLVSGGTVDGKGK